MLSKQQAATPNRPAPLSAVPAVKKARGKWILLFVVALGVAGGAGYLIREQNRKAVRLATLQLARDHHPDASDRLVAYLAGHPDDAEMLEALIEWQLWAKAPFAEIEPRLDRFCSLRPNDLNSFRVRARFRIQNGRPDEGLADAQRVLELDPTDHNTRKLAAIAATEAGRYDIAALEFTRVLESTPLQRHELALMLARSYLQAGDTAKAEQVLNQYFPEAESNAEAFVLRGRAHQVAGRHEAAIAVFRTSADKFADQREFALYLLAESQRTLHRDEDSARTLEELERYKARDRIVKDGRQQPDNMAAQIRAAEQLLSDGKPAEAAAMLEQAVRRLGKTPAAGKVLAKAYRQVGRNDLAAEWERFADGK